MGADLGSIEVGKLADLVVVDGDPPTTITDLRRTRRAVGRWAITLTQRQLGRVVAACGSLVGVGAFVMSYPGSSLRVSDIPSE